MSVTRYIDTEELDIRNPLFLVDTEVTIASGTDNRDIGFVGKYYDGTNLVYTGLFRDATDSHFKLFQELQELPLVNTGSVNIAGTGYTLASLDALNFHATGTLTVDGALTANGDLTVMGSVSILDVATLMVEDNIILANSGPLNQKSDSGFCSKRPAANIIADDVAKQSGTASAAGTTTTVTLQAANGHGTTLDYYKGWVVSLGGDVTGTAICTTSTAADPPTLTLDTAASAATTVATTYGLFNKHCVGMIHDESTGMLTAYGFPREDTMGAIDPAGNAGDGNLADFVDFKANNITAANNLTIGGTATITGAITLTQIDTNILTINTGPNHLGSDGGYCSQRTPVNVVTNDTAKIAAVAIQTSYVSGSTTLLITNAAVGTDYYKGWVIRYNVNITEPTYITASTETGGTHTLTLNTAFSVPLVAGTDTVDLFNKRFVGSIYSEATDNYTIVGFPRDINESVIDINAPVNGNIPDYINIAVNNLYIDGTLNATNFVGSLKKNTEVFVAATTFAVTDIMNYGIIYLNPTANTTYTLPSIASIALDVNKSKETIFINISTFVATIASDAADNLEGLASLNLSSQYSKTMLTVASGIANAWTIS
jgi:hypothetical protein